MSDLTPLGQEAVRLARAGFYLHPCISSDKRPLLADWQHRASNDPQQVEAWWREWPDANIGVVPDLSGHFILDIDVKGEKNGLLDLADLEYRHGPLPDTLTITTPSGGEQRWFRGQAPTSADKRDGLDYRGGRGDGKGRGYGLLPPSRTPKGEYQWKRKGKAADAPPWQIADAETRVSRSKPVAAVPYEGTLDASQNVTRAATFMASQPAVDPGARDDTAFKHACKLLDMALSPAVARELLGQWNDTNPDPLDAADLDRIIASAADNRDNKGCAPLAVGDPKETFKQAAAAAGALQETAGYPPSLSAAELAAGVFPRPVWLIPSLILEGHVNLLVGDGKVGKTFAILHMAVAVAAGLTLWGQECRQAPVLMVLSEDDYGETKARLGGICAALGVKLDTLPIEFWCLPSENLILARVADNGAVTDGPFLQPLLAKISETGARCVFLDPLSDFADLDETKRLAANAYCKKVLGPLSHKLGVTVVQTAHPSKASMEDHSVVSGSTAWKNAVRNVLSMERQKEDQPSPRRILRGAWVNYGEETSLELSLVAGVLCKAGDYPEGSNPHAEAKEAVFETVASLLGKGKQIVRTHGNGLKPNDVAAEVAKRTGLKLHKTLVLTLLNELDREDRLAYRTGGNKTRGQLAGFYIPSEGAE